jgi:hypothetical protein
MGGMTQGRSVPSECANLTGVASLCLGSRLVLGCEFSQLEQTSFAKYPNGFSAPNFRPVQNSPLANRSANLAEGSRLVHQSREVPLKKSITMRYSPRELLFECKQGADQSEMDSATMAGFFSIVLWGFMGLIGHAEKSFSMSFY